MGTSNFAVPILKSLYQNGYPVSVVYTQPPKKSNRGMKTQKSPVHNMAETLNIDVRTPENLKGNLAEYNFLEELGVDLAIVVAYGKILPENFLPLAKMGFINIHASILPSWRGAAPIQRSIMNLDKETGISIMRINENLDEGPVCNQYSLKISEEMNSEELSEKLSLIASEKILDILDNIDDGNLKFKDQDHSKATYAKKIQKTQGKIDWNENAEKILGQNISKSIDLYPIPNTSVPIPQKVYELPLPKQFFSSESNNELRLHKLGEIRWIYLSLEPSKAWPMLQEYLNQNKELNIARANPKTGEIFTEEITSGVKTEKRPNKCVGLNTGAESYNNKF